MEDDRIRELFNDFDPDLSPDNRFIERLQRGMDVVESVRRQNVIMRKRNRIAVAIAALAGFVTGVSLTLLFPLIGRYVSTIHIAVPKVDLMIDFQYVAWLLTAVASMLIALNTYEIVMAGLTGKEVMSSGYGRH